MAIAYRHRRQPCGRLERLLRQIVRRPPRPRMSGPQVDLVHGMDLEFRRT